MFWILDSGSLFKVKLSLPSDLKFKIVSNFQTSHCQQGDELPFLLNNFESLVDQPWASRKELLGIVYGSSLDALHPSTEFEEKQLSRQAALMDNFAQSAVQVTPPRIEPRQYINCICLQKFTVSQELRTITITL